MRADLDAMHKLTLGKRLEVPYSTKSRNSSPAIQTLRTVWLQQYYSPHDIRWRSAEDMPPHAQLLTSPYDVEARFAMKRQTSWTGYKVHLTDD